MFAVSVVVATRNRVDRLKRCVDALRAVRTENDWELIIVDNASTDGTAAFLASLPQDGCCPRIKFLTEPIPGKGRALNAAWRASQGAIIGFTDDDCYVAPDYVDAVLAAFDRDVGFVGGRVLLFDQDDLPITITTRETALDFLPNTFVAAGDLFGANMAFRRETLERIDGFDEDLGPGTRFVCDDTDVQARAIWNDIGGTYDPRIVVFHHHGRRGQGERRKLTDYYDKGRGAYYAKMVLGRRSRRVYLRIWKIKALEDFRGATTVGGKWLVLTTLARELFGAAQYLLHVTWRPSRVPAP